MTAAATQGYHQFDSAIGPCAVAWGTDAAGGLCLTGVQLPEGDAAAGLRRLARLHPQAGAIAPPADVAAWIARILDLIATGRGDLSDLRLDLARVPPADAAVYRLAVAIPAGETRTYGALAKALNPPGNPRFVGQALGRNPWPIVVPCHRILAAQGGTGGFSARGGVGTKLRLLAIERAVLPGGPTLFDGDPGFGLSVAPDARFTRDPRRPPSRGRD
ncbi:methylated-DNA--[protein]-cysteine S-methyltransferase [Zavarzinia sp. CC-PAN008]|uniref:methylated-DNA--[protein]-cysteine S-methyltransferase n=1 Tax=Zavarzinia sp. CC-PAN008 TaxID=3243332 RepID=UPI003F748689